MKRLFGAIIVLVVVAPLANAHFIETLYARNNGGAFGGAVYLDAVVGGIGLIVTGFDTNTNETGITFGWTVFTRDGTAEGFESSSAGWMQVATGTGTGAGLNVPTHVTMNNTFILAANATTGLAFVMGSEAGHDYTNGDVGSGYGGGGNQTYSNPDLTLNLGSANNTPFSSGAFNPRIWNGTMFYTPVPEPATMAILGLGILPFLRRRRNKKA